ncbi:ectoine/hydroxyectoine ABC transporter substrate-binding protein EhuB [Nocardiopsis lambiniae]|uniref:Ectoine/hydroxyectoine ABC transporter substrate-binding protein EhuB n=1 Tax=Nocardiopsis lambiniae TaxID=3075539 RepID=A0ABU2MDS6_9ACTN|nr:ectoine/hydroxyectoine ABC transporter substrate-binding protein EhuB [Nocardiopsis sp. DSM 44743]MDT0330729.1 ectoine/hydroxyectoine ABC transporter substrate-binding protein EhuB [Nocardiopsis sp. DSM 44743]
MQVPANRLSRFGRRDAFRLAGAGAVTLGLAACTRVDQGGNGEEGGASTLERLREQGFVSVGLSNEIPFGFVDGSGEPAGQSPAVAQAVFEELGVPEIQASPVSWDGLIPGLQANRFDVIAAGMFITPDRCEQVAFTEPTATSPEAFLVAEGNPHDIQHFTDFADNPDIRLAVLNASVEQTYAEHFGVPTDQMRLIPDQTTGYELLDSGRVDAVSMLKVSHEYLLLERGGDFEVTEAFFPEIDGREEKGWGGLCVRPADSALLEEMNRVIAEFTESGRLLELGEEWGFTEADLPDGTTTDELCEA